MSPSLQERFDALPAEEKAEIIQHWRTVGQQWRPTLELLRDALRPGSVFSDLFIIYKAVTGGELCEGEDSEEAIARVVARMKPSLKNPNARKALQRLTDEWNQTKSDKITPQALLKEHLLPAGIRLAAKSIDAKAKIRVRIGKDWLKDRSGKVPEIDPGHLPFPDLAQWVFQEAQRDAAETVLEHVKPESIIIDGLEDLPRDSPSILDLLILAEDRRNPPRLNRDDLLKIATTQHERMFIKLAEQGLSLKQIARRMRKTPHNVYQINFRLKEKVRKKLKS